MSSTINRILSSTPPTAILKASLIAGIPIAIIFLILKSPRSLSTLLQKEDPERLLAELLDEEEESVVVSGKTNPNSNNKSNKNKKLKKSKAAVAIAQEAKKTERSNSIQTNSISVASENLKPAVSSKKIYDNFNTVKAAIPAKPVTDSIKSTPTPPKATQQQQQPERQADTAGEWSKVPTKEEETIQMLRHRIQTLQNREHEEGQRRKEAEQQVAHLARRTIELEKELKERSTSLHQMMLQKDNESTQNVKEVGLLKKKLEKLSSDSQLLERRSKAEAESLNKKISEQKDISQKEISSLNMQLRESKERYLISSDCIVELENQVRSLESEISRLTSVNKSDLEVMEDKLKNVLEELSLLKDEKSSIEQTLKQEISCIQEQLSSEKEEILTLKDEIEKGEKKFGILKNVMASKDQKMEAEVVILKEKILRLQEEGENNCQLANDILKESQ